MLEGSRHAQQAGADLVEVRLDALAALDPSNDIPRIIAESALPVIITLRPTWEGGQCELPEPRRLAALKYAAILGAAFVDVEFKVASYFFENFGEVAAGTAFIVSSHNFETTPPLAELEAHVVACRALTAAAPAPLVIKLVTTAQDAGDALRVLGLLRRTTAAGQAMIGLAMGPAGLPSRLLAGACGGALTFATLEDGVASAPGQPTLDEVLDRYRLREQHPGGTPVWGVVGNPVAHSKGPLIHNAMLQAAQLPGVYLPFLVHDLPRFLDEATGSGIDLRGLSVTIPHKEAALAAADEADELATGIGAANTLVWPGPGQGGACRAYNTDAGAAIRGIEAGLEGGKPRASPRPSPGASPGPGASPLLGRTVVVLGAGGAGRAVAFGAAAAGASVVVANRTAVRATELAAAVAAALPGSKVVAAPLQDIRDGSVAGDVLVNTTQIGMHPKVEESPVPASVLGAYTLVFDAVYTPLHTRLLQDAKAAGCLVVTGDTMFLGQAAEQFRLFTGQPADLEVMRAALAGGHA